MTRLPDASDASAMRALPSLHTHARLAVTAAIFSAACVLLRRASHYDRLRTTLAIGRLVGRLAHALVPFRRAVARENMQRLAVTPSEQLDGISTERLDELQRLAYVHLGRSLALSLIAGEWLQRHLHLPQELPSLVDDLQSGGALVCSAHLGVWELLPTALAPHLPERARRLGLVVYRPLHHRRLNHLVLRRRAASGIHLLPDRGAAPAMRAALRRGGLVGMLPDQRPSRSGVAATFLRQAVDFSPGLATLHHATGAPVWFCVLLLDADRQTDRQQPDQHTTAERPSPTLRLHLLRLAERRPPAAAAADGAAPPPVDCAPLVQAYADALSSAVEASPEQYFWWHKRFSGRDTGK